MATLGSTMPAVIDQLITQFQGLTFTFPIGGVDYAVTDGFPGDFAPQLIISVGGTANPTGVDKVVWAGLGAGRRWENYLIEVVISVVVGGDGSLTPETAGDAQKTARDIAFAAGHAIESNLLGDLTLGGVFTAAGRLGGWMNGVSDLTLHQTSDVTAADGASVEVVLQVDIKARI